MVKREVADPFMFDLMVMDLVPCVWLLDRDQKWTRTQAKQYGIDLGLGLEDAAWIDVRCRVEWKRWDFDEALREYHDEYNVHLCPGEAWCPIFSASVDQVWVEDGTGCPWMDCKRTDAGAVKWWRVWDHSIKEARA